MHKTIRQVILGLGTFGTGTALLYLEVNPYLLVLTDTVVGIGMLFAAGSLSVSDLGLGRGQGARESAAPAGTTATPPQAPTGAPRGLLASLGKFRSPLKPAMEQVTMGKEEKEVKVKEIDRMLDTALAGQSRRLISIAEGQGALAGPAVAGAGAVPVPEGEPLDEFAAPVPDEEGAEEEDQAAQPGTPAPAALPLEEVSPASVLLGHEEGKDEAQVEVLPVADEGLGADDLLTALRREAMREKARDDTSLYRDLKGVRVTGRQLLEELDSLVKEIRER